MRVSPLTCSLDFTQNFVSVPKNPPSGKSPHPADGHSSISYFARPQPCQPLSDCASAVNGRSEGYAEQQISDVKYGSYDTSALFITPYFT